MMEFWDRGQGSITAESVMEQATPVQDTLESTLRITLGVKQPFWISNHNLNAFTAVA